MPSIQVWTEERLADLRVLCADERKLSAAQIADMLHVKRNAVIGACFRNKIKLPRKSSGGTPRKLKGRANQGRKFNFTKPSVEKPVEIKLADVVPLNVSLDDLQPHECRYPYGDGPFLFCGNPVEGESSYCAAHHRLCWQKPREITDEERERRHQWGLSISRKGPLRKGVAA